MNQKRAFPSILIAGTPGTGKTTTAELFAASFGGKYVHINVGDFIKEHQCYDGYDEDFDTMILSEDKLCDALEEILSPNEPLKVGYILDYHSCDFFPPEWLDLVVVLSADNTILYDRLEERGYSQKKIQENIECEIMQVVLEEAREAFEENAEVQMPQIMNRSSNTVAEMEETIECIRGWVNKFLEH